MKGRAGGKDTQGLAGSVSRRTEKKGVWREEGREEEEGRTRGQRIGRGRRSMGEVRRERGRGRGKQR